MNNEHGDCAKMREALDHDIRSGVMAFGFEFEAPDDAGAKQNPGGEG